MPTHSPIRPRGRPRDLQAEASVLQTTWELLEDTSVRDVTIEAISANSGVSRPTIYRWWPNKNAVVVDAVFAKFAHEISYEESGSATVALTSQLTRVLKLLRGRPGRVLAELLAEGQADPNTLTSLKERFLNKRRAEARAVIERGKAAGEFAKDIDAELAIDLIYGPLYYRLMAQHLPLPKRLADDLVRWGLHGLSPR